MANRWEYRTEPGPGQRMLYWHILLGDQLQVKALASIGRERLAHFDGLHFTPLRWLHITTLVIGSADEITTNYIEAMTDNARYLLSGLQPISITLSTILYHPEAIILKVDPRGILNPIRDALLNATRIATKQGTAVKSQSWIPHVTLAYSTAIQPADPIIAALGHKLPTREAKVEAVSLIAQEGAERLWTWHRLADIPLGSPRRA